MRQIDQMTHLKGMLSEKVYQAAIKDWPAPNKSETRRGEAQHSPELPSAMLESVGYHKGFKAAKAHADKLAEALRELHSLAGRHIAHYSQMSAAMDAQDALAAYEAAQ